MTDNNAPWTKPPPKHAGATGRHLTPEQLQEAKTRAAKAGRRYPNLVDNMAVASGHAGKTAKATAKKAKKKTKALGGRAGARQKTAARRAAKKKKTAKRRKK